MQGAEWARLSQSFSPEAFGWYVVETSTDRERVRLAPYLMTKALVARLDDVVGLGGWSFQLAPLAGGNGSAPGLVCNLTIGDVTRAAVAASQPGPQPDSQPDPRQVAEVALSRCAELFGISLPVAADDGWVDSDSDDGEPLFTPELVAAAAVAAGVTDELLPADGQPAAVAAEPGRPDGQQVIDRLLERLKAEGLGKDAARLLVEHHGYGRTPEEARVLYGKLRGLLVEKKLVSP